MHSLALTEDGAVWMWGEPWGDFALAVERNPTKVSWFGIRLTLWLHESLGMNFPSVAIGIRYVSLLPA